MPRIKLGKPVEFYVNTEETGQISVEAFSEIQDQVEEAIWRRISWVVGWIEAEIQQSGLE